MHTIWDDTTHTYRHTQTDTQAHRERDTQTHLQTHANTHTPHTDYLLSLLAYCFKASFYAPATVHKWCGRRTVFGSVLLWVSECVLKTLWTPYLKNQWSEFHLILVTDVFGFVVLISLWDQRSEVKVTADNESKTGWYSIFVNIFTKIGSCMYLYLRHTD